MPGEKVAAAIAMLRTMKAKSDADAALPIAKQRAKLEKLAEQFPLPDDIGVRAVDAGGVSADVLTLPESSPDAYVVYLHGGAYCFGSPRTHREIAARIGRAARATVLVPAYRLAPEHPFPAALDDVLAAHGWLVRSHGIAAASIAFAGDSAGGGLALAAALALRDAGGAPPAAIAMMSPWVDLTCTSPSFAANRDLDPVLRADELRRCARWYAAERDVREPALSPLFAGLASLPPLLIQAGTLEILHDDAPRLADAARAAGTAVELAIGDGLFHGWQQVASLPEAAAATDRIGAFLRANRGQVPFSAPT